MGDRGRPVRAESQGSLRQRRGDWAERYALELLRRRGWRLLDRQWRCRWGELDLVVCKGRRLLLVEVKARSGPGPDGGGRGALGAPKRHRLMHAWACWLAAHPAWGDAPVEMVAALVPLPPARAPVRWLRLEL
jgi:putative endonuclease